MSPADDKSDNVAPTNSAQAICTQRVLDLIPQLIFTKDCHGRYTMINAEVEKLFGLPRSEILGKTDIELNHFPVDQERFTKEDQEIISTGQDIHVPEEVLYHTTSNSKRWYQTWKRPLFDQQGNVEQIIGIGIDITERRAAEQALQSILSGTASKTAEEFFRSLVFHLAKVLETRFAFISRLREDQETCDTLAVWYNGQFISNSSYLVDKGPTGKILGRDFHLYSEGVTKIFSTDKHLIEHGIESYMGATIWDSNGKILGILSVMDDKPMQPWEPAKNIMRIFADRAGAEFERIEKESAYRQLQENLLQSQKLEALGRLAAGVAHDLNNALSAVVGHLEMLSTDKTLNTDASESVGIALQGCQRASSLIEQLLGFSRQGRYVLENTNLQILINNTLSFLSRVLPKNINIEKTLPHAPIGINADLGQMQQAITNLILNACQAMPNGGTLKIDCTQSHINDVNRHNIKALPGNFACLTITDSGCGISKEHLSRVFEPFFTTKHNGKGTGLGLSMVYGTLQNHGGWVEIDSEVNRGTRCSLFIPTTNASMSIVTEAQDESSKLNTTQIRHLLIVDDETTLVELGMKFAERYGFKATGFSSPTTALEWYKLNYHNVDMIILDMKMPGISGERCFTEFKSINETVKIVLLSGYSQDTAVQDLLARGAIKFMQKPVKYSDLMEWIKNYFLNTLETKRVVNY